jgi:accessory colonization factor AcfC
MNYGGEGPNIAIVEDAAERLRKAGYSVTVEKKHTQHEWRQIATHEVEIVLRASKNLLKE